MSNLDYLGGALENFYEGDIENPHLVARDITVKEDGKIIASGTAAEIKDSLKDKNLYVEIKGHKCKVLGRIGMFHVSVDITEKDIEINDEVILNVSPMFVDSSIRREYR